MQDDIGYLIKLVSEQLKKRFDKDLVRFGLTLSQLRIIWYVHYCGGESSQKEIENFLQVSHPTVVGLIGRMEKKGFVTSTINPDDHRSRLISTTEKADAFRELNVSSKKAAEKIVCKNLSAHDISELKRMLTIIYQNLSDEEIKMEVIKS